TSAVSPPQAAAAFPRPCARQAGTASCWFPPSWPAPRRLFMMVTNGSGGNRHLPAIRSPFPGGPGLEPVRRAAGRTGDAGEDIAGVRLRRHLRRGEVLAGGGDVQGGEVVPAEGHRSGLLDREPDDRVEFA